MKLEAEEFALLRRRDKGVTARFYDLYAEKVATFFYVKCFGNRAVVDDLTQETFCAFINYAPRLKSREHVQYTLFAIAKNKLSDYQRKIFREKERKAALMEDHDPPPDIIEEIHERQKALLFSMALECLNDGEREIYGLHYEDEKTIAGIAEGLGVTYKSIDGKLCRLRDKLKKEMKRLGKDFFPEGKGS